MTFKKKGLPSHLENARKREAEEKLALIVKHRDRITADARAGKLTREYIEGFGLAAFCIEAGAHGNYLNGPTGRTVKKSIKDLKAELRALLHASPLQEPHPTDRSDAQVIEDLQIENARLLSMLHGARLQLHSQRQIIKSLGERPSPKVVPLKSN